METQGTSFGLLILSIKQSWLYAHGRGWGGESAKGSVGHSHGAGPRPGGGGGWYGQITVLTGPPVSDAV